MVSGKVETGNRLASQNVTNVTAHEARRPGRLALAMENPFACSCPQRREWARVARCTVAHTAKSCQPSPTPTPLRLANHQFHFLYFGLLASLRVPSMPFPPSSAVAQTPSHQILRRRVPSPTLSWPLQHEACVSLQRLRCFISSNHRSPISDAFG
jgi:hypothetical protein